MKMVFLDGGSLPSSLACPLEAVDWVDRATTSAEDVVIALQDAQVAITNKVAVTRETISVLPDLKFICVAATGYDCVDIAACRDHGVIVSNVPAYSALSVAESVISSIFALRRHLFSYRDAAGAEWPDSPYFCVHREPIRDVRGSTLGIIGNGDIGRCVASLASSIGMNVLLSEHRNASSVRSGYTAFQDVISESDAISLHCPLTPMTRRLIGENEIAMMKFGALLINTARGPLVDADAVLHGLATGQLGGAALDVLDSEPPLHNCPVLKAKNHNLIVTPHVGWASQSSVVKLKSVLHENIAAFVSGHPINVVS